MRTQVVKRLKMSTQEYEILVFNIWLEWCQKKTNTPQSLQKALICKQLFSWWLIQLQKLETVFLEETRIYADNLDQSAAEDYYRMVTAKVHNHFSKPLIRKAND